MLGLNDLITSTDYGLSQLKYHILAVMISALIPVYVQIKTQPMMEWDGGKRSTSMHQIWMAMAS
jgi:hypothetical protein